MIDRLPRAGYGYGIIRMSRTLTRNIAPLAQVKLTDTQGYLKDAGVFEQVKQNLHLPDDYSILGIYIEPCRFTWCVLLEAPDVPIPEEGAMLPVLIPVYSQTYDYEKRLVDIRFERVEISVDPYLALRVD